MKARNQINTPRGTPCFQYLNIHFGKLNENERKLSSAETAMELCYVRIEVWGRLSSDYLQEDEWSGRKRGGQSSAQPNECKLQLDSIGAART